MRNKVLNIVQAQLNSSLFNINLSKFIGEYAVIIFDKKYKVEKITGYEDPVRMKYDDERGRIKGDISMVFTTDVPTKFGWERVDFAVIGDGLKIGDKIRYIKEIDPEFITFTDGLTLFLPVADINIVPDYLSQLGDMGIKIPDTNTTQPSASDVDKDLVVASQPTNDNLSQPDTVIEPTATIVEVPKTKTLADKIKELELIPLFPDLNYFEGKSPNFEQFRVSDDTISCYVARHKADLALYIRMEYQKATSKGYFCSWSFSVARIDPSEDSLFEIQQNKPEAVYFDNLPEVLNKFNELYEVTAKEFNKRLMEQIKDELEKEKQKKKEQEQSDENKEPSNADQDQSKSDSSDNYEKEKDMNSDEIQNLLDELEDDSQEGQSSADSNTIDFEDFIDQVDDGKTENDFTANYNNKELKDKIDEEKKSQPEITEASNNSPFSMPDKQNPQNDVDKIFNPIKKLLGVSDEEMKRRFPTENAVKDFINSLTKAEVNSIVEKSGLFSDLKFSDVKKEIANQMITKIQNIE